MSGDQVYRRANGGRVAFSAAVVDVLQRHRQLGPKATEAGGVLLGRIISDTGDVVVDEVTEPMPGDSRSRFSFLRRKEPAQRHVKLAWATSKGTRIYLGEWHSHPEDRPTPSPQDLRNWRAIVDRATYTQDALLFVIVGRGDILTWDFGRFQPAPLLLEPV